MFNRHDFISYLKHPTLERKENNIGNGVSVLKLVGQAYLFYLFVIVIGTLPLIVTLHFLELLPEYKPIDLNALNIFKITLVAPIFEELIFRLPLKFSKINLTVSLGLFLYLITRKIDIILAVSLTALFLGFMILSLIKESEFQPGTKKLFSKYFQHVFYFQAVIFGFLHLPNFYLDFRYFYLFPLFIVSYIFIGCILGYLRVVYTNGLYICIILHMFTNTIGIILG